MLDYTDGLHYISYDIGILKYWGVWPFLNKNTSLWKVILYRTYSLFMITVLIAFAIGQMYDSYMIITDVIAISENASVLFSTTAMLFKVLTLTFKRPKLERVIKILQSDDFVPKTETHKKIVKSYIKHIRLVQKGFFWTTVFTVSNYMIFPLFDVNKVHPTPVRFPIIDVKAPIYYESFYGFVVLALGSTATLDAIMDTFMPGFMCHAMAQLDCLRNTMENIAIDDVTEYRSTIIKKRNNPFYQDNFNEVTLKRLKDAALHYDRIANYVSEVGELFNIAVCFQYFSSCMVICCNGILLLVVQPEERPFKFIATVSYLGLMLFEIFMLCWYGNEIMLKSDIMGFALYSTMWMDCSTQFKRGMTIFVEATKKPIVITAGKMFELTLKSFTGILNTSYSYFALLRSFFGTK